MRTIPALIFLVIFSLSVISEEINYYPDLSLSSNKQIHDMLGTRYSTFLTIFGESELSENLNETYRFLWLRTFHEAILIKLDTDSKSLNIKSIEGASGFSDSLNGASMDKSLTIKDDQIKSFTQLAEKEFWPNDVTREQFTCKDGATWILEGRKKGQYHVQNIHCPKDTDSTEILGKILIELSGYDPEYVY